MKIQIKTRLNPFSHLPGEEVLIPCSNCVLRAYPAKLLFYSLANPEEKYEIDLDVKGPVREFTVKQDLEKAKVLIFGKGKEGFFRHEVKAGEKGIDALGQTLTFSTYRFLKQKKSLPQISFGSKKGMCMSGIRKRKDPADYLPLLFRLADLTPPAEVKRGIGGTESLLRTLSWDTLEGFFLAAFKGFLVPTLEDNLHQGLVFESLKEKGSPVFLLTESARVLGEKICSVQRNKVRFLEKLPPKKPCGKWVEVLVGEFGTLSFEWSKKRMRRLFFKASKEGTLTFEFPKSIASFRMNGVNKKGCQIEFSFKAWEAFSFDRFEK